MLSGVHFLLSYDCTYECDHCFVYSGPCAGGTFTINQIKEVLAEARKIDTMKAICFEGGEPFMYYPVLLEGIRQANAAGFTVILVTNCYFANSDADIELFFAPLKDLDIADLSISDDSFHGDEEASAKARRAVSLPMLPMPTNPSCFCQSSAPLNFFFSHLPALREAVVWGRRRARANMWATASSATLIALAPGVFSTTISRSPAATR